MNFDGAPSELHRQLFESSADSGIVGAIVIMSFPTHYAFLFSMIDFVSDLSGTSDLCGYSYYDLGRARKCK
jgi:hypothetical protein